jgi:tetratricopeptide (TPR) repeat protein
MGKVDWHGGAPDAAFEQARILGKPLFLYWGAGWCPPCNRIKASVFTHPEFLALAPQFVALHIDGDSAGAQQLAERYKLRSYPTLVVYRPDGTEITRLPCELGPKRFIHTLERALHANYTAAESLSAALSRERPLSAAEWCLLSNYSWDTDERQLLKSLDFAATVASMTRSCTEPDAALRLRWHSLHAAASAGLGGIDRAAAIDEIVATLADSQAVREQMDIVINYAVDLVRFLSDAGSAARLRLAGAWADALAILEDDATLGLGDRLQALRTRVRMARLGAPIPGLEQLARERVARAMAAVSEPALRHTVLNTAAGVLSDSGLLDDAEQLLLAELERSHSQYYFMHNLAAIAKKRGDPARAVQWYERAWDLATGPATRLQWGTAYLQGLVDFAPGDAPRIDRLAGQMLDELNGRDDAFYQRNRTQMQRIGSSMAKWSGASERAAALREAARPA